MSQYYYMNQNNEPSTTPCSLEDLKKLVVAGVITNTTLVNPVGTGDWITFKKALEGDGGDTKPNPIVVAFQKAWEVFKKLASDPVGRLPAAAQELGPTVSQNVGIAFGVVFMVSVILSGMLGSSGVPFLPKPTRSDFFQFLIVSATPFVCFLATIALTRVIFKGKGAIGTDCLIAGTALLPFAVLAPLVALLGIQNMEISLLLTALAVSTCYLLLYSGCTGVNQLSTRAATLAMPIILLGSSWLAKIVIGALIKPSARGFTSPF